jgi:hypothetical protein
MTGKLINSLLVLNPIAFKSSLKMAAVQKVALITAGTAGLGAQIARALAPDFRLVSETHHLCNQVSIPNMPR